MAYLIDGNNVMAQTVGWHRDKPRARKRLIGLLARFVAVERANVKVVFDGSPDEEFPEGTRFKSVHILYARPGLDADSRIEELVGKSAGKRDLVVVTSDKVLASKVTRQGARLLTSGKFRRILEAAQVRRKEKPGEFEPVDVDEWESYFTGCQK